MPLLRVLIADDHAVVRRGLRQILAEQPDMTVAGEAKDGDEVLRLLRRQSWDVLVLDLNMPGRGGLEVLNEVKRLKPALPVLILSMHSEEQYAVRVMKAGAAGYLTKESAPDELVNAIRKVGARDGKYITSSLAERLAAHIEERADRAPHERLTDREYEILRLLAAGVTATQIAEQLSLSVKTVSTHRTHILEKMNLRTTAQLIRYAVEKGLA